MATLAVEKAWAFYKTSYDVVSRYDFSGITRQSIGQMQPRRCRYCHLTALETSFRKVAHTVPTLIGNTTLFSLDECSACNSRFGLLEDDLGKFIMPSRAIGRVAGYGGVPDEKFRSGAKVKVDQSGNMHVIHNREDLVMEDDPATNTIRIRFELQAYRPLAVYKAFTKMAFGALSAAEASDLDACRRWLASDGVTEGLPIDSLSPCVLETETGLIANNPSITIFRRKPTAQTFYATAVIFAGNCTYQFFLPAPMQDKQALKSGKPVLPFPPPLAADREITKGRLTIHDLTEPRRVRGQIREQTFTYGCKEEL